MPRNEQDPAGSTQQFRAFAGERDSSGSSPGLIVGVGAAVLVVAVVLVVLFVA